MCRNRLTSTLTLLLTTLSAGPITADPTADAIHALWQADTAKASHRAVAAIEQLELDFPTLYGLLSQGPAYSADVITGRRVQTRARDFHYILWVPESYDPGKRYPVRVYLHGGVSRPQWTRDGGWWRNEEKVRSEEHLVLLPASWYDAMWWQRSQVENLEAILRRVRGEYNVDENRIHMIGVSDGATGAWFHAFRKPMPWASFVSLIGHPKVLTNAGLDVDGELFTANLRNRAFYVVNGGVDRLYPARSILPFLQLFHGDGTEIIFRPQPDGGHDLRFWPSEAAAIEEFMQQHPRDPLPDTLVWGTEDPEHYGRHHWLQILELGKTGSDVELKDANKITRHVPGPTLGAQMVPEPESDGVKVRCVQPGSVGKEAGLRIDDVILRVEDEPTPTVEHLARTLNERAHFEGSLPITVRRGKREKELILRFPQAPPPAVPEQAFPRHKPSGRVELSRDGNRIEAQTRGVRSFRLLLSPDELDFQQPIRVVVNGIEVLNRLVALDRATLLRWAAEDRDRTQLFAAQVTIDVPN